MYSCYAKMGVSRKAKVGGIPVGALSLASYTGDTSAHYAWTLCSITSVGTSATGTFGCGAQIDETGRIVVGFRPTSSTTAVHYTNADKSLLLKATLATSLSIPNAVVMSKSADYIVVTGSLTGEYHQFSSNFGTSFSNITASNPATQRVLNDVAISGNGQYILCIGYNDGAHPYLSTDYGATFNVISSIGAYNTCWVSNSGQNMLVAGSSGGWYSTNYGSSWATFSASNTIQSITASNDMTYVAFNSLGGCKFSTNFPNSGSPTWTTFTGVTNTGQNGGRITTSANGNVTFVINNSDNKCYYSLSKSTSLTAVETTWTNFGSHSYISCDISQSGLYALLTTTTALIRINFVSSY